MQNAEIVLESTEHNSSKPELGDGAENSTLSKRVPLLEITPLPSAKLNGRKRKANQSEVSLYKQPERWHSG